MQLDFKTECNKQIIEDIINLEKSVYNDTEVGTYENIAKRCLAYPTQLFTIYQKDELIAYACTFPIADSLVKIIKNNLDVLQDDNIGPEYIDTNSNTMFIISIAVKPEYQKQGYGRTLMNFIRIQCPIHNLLGGIISNGGEALAKEAGMEHVGGLYWYHSYDKNWEDI